MQSCFKMHRIFCLGTDIEMAIVVNENSGNAENPTELETNSETSPGGELQPLKAIETATCDQQIKSNESQDRASTIISEEEMDPLFANETSTDAEAKIIDLQTTEFLQEATNISLSSNIVVTTINETKMTKTTAKKEANYDNKGIYVKSSQ